MYKFIKLDDVKNITGLSKSSIYQLIAEGQFPDQIKISKRSVAWIDSEVTEWMSNCVSNSRTQPAQAMNPLQLAS